MYTYNYIHMWRAARNVKSPPANNYGQHRLQVFSEFLLGKTLQECYAAVGAVANRWLDLLDTHGMDLQDSELIGYISESRMMSKSLEEFGDRKSSALTTAKRLSQFLGDERIKEKGLACNYVISKCAPTPSCTAEQCCRLRRNIA